MIYDYKRLLPLNNLAQGLIAGDLKGFFTLMYFQETLYFQQPITAGLNKPKK
ncbi:hypothetical protein GPLA_2566 [Paraglaciecola polaris LMG 21857]|uniref:Uncharacterized protein n=1 Tax=Paraglaciecola polaris LMG 21857 TaxID=1129793 RepID=K6YL83_9ALTE|nr:hypothetical protein GPLA_2566 [Paraglaciecola polaris LMG 21857]